MSTITITFGDQAESHVGMTKIGQLLDSGFSLQELKVAKKKFEEIGLECELVDLVARGNLDADNGDCAAAYVLIVRGGAEIVSGGSTALFKEQQKLDPDQKAKMRGRVVNKHARYNLCFSDFSQEADFDNNKGTVKNFKDLECLNELRELLPEYLGDKATILHAEGNYYYDTSKCGIGWHGDAERKVVIAIRLGDTMPLCYNWFRESAPFGDKIELEIRNGDLYVMSEKATGFDWKKRKVPTLRHSAGCNKYTKL